MHLYTPEKIGDNQTTFSSKLSAFNRVDINEFNQHATASNQTWSGIGVGLGGAFLLLAITVGVAGGDWGTLTLGGGGPL